MGRRLEKWKKTLDSDKQKKAFDNQKKEMARKESIHTKELVKIEQQVKQIADEQPIIRLPYYIIFGKEVYSKSLKFTDQTLRDEVCILLKKWWMRGLDPDFLDRIIELLVPSHVTCDFIPEDCRLFWPYSHASIPAGWGRDTDYDDKFPQAHPTTGLPGTTGGAVNHNHTVNDHAHTTPAHIHIMRIQSPPILTENVQTVPFGVTSFATSSHQHNDTNSQSANPTTSDDSSTITQNSAEPQNRLSILIKPNNDKQLIPPNSVLLSDSTTIPTGFHITDGAGGTLDFDARFTRMPVALADGGATSGTLTHNHLNAGGHAHTITHTHADSDFGMPTATIDRFAGVVGVGTSGFVSHHTATRIRPDNTNVPAQTEDFDYQSNDPPFIQLLGLQCTATSQQEIQEDMILPYVGDTASVPLGWTLCDGSGAPDVRDKQIKITINPLLIGATGGSATHWHTGAGHIHASTSHGHFYTMRTTAYSGSGGATSIAHSTHAHITHSMVTNSMFYNSNFSTTQTADGRLPFKTLHYIKKI